MGPNTVCEIVAKAQPIDPTFLYYLYSTIAQTLAAAFAFLGAFVLFKLQGIDRTCENLAASVMDIVETNLYYGRSFKIQLYKAKSGDWKDFANQLEETFEDKRKSGSDKPSDEKIREELNNNFPQYGKFLENAGTQEEIKNDFKCALYWTIAAIFFSIVFLGVVPALAKNPWAAYIPAILIMLSSFVCLYRYAHIILRAFGVQLKRKATKAAS